MNVLHLVVYDWRFSVGVTLVGLGFFGALTIHSFLRPNKRISVTGLLLIDLGVFASLIRTLFFFDLSPHPTQLGVYGGWQRHWSWFGASSCSYAHAARARKRAPRLDH
jgi:hypothetical protein